MDFVEVLVDSSTRLRRKETTNLFVHDTDKFETWNC